MSNNHKLKSLTIYLQELDYNRVLLQIDITTISLDITTSYYMNMSRNVITDSITDTFRDKIHMFLETQGVSISKNRITKMYNDIDVSEKSKAKDFYEE